VSSISFLPADPMCGDPTQENFAGGEPRTSPRRWPCEQPEDEYTTRRLARERVAVDRTGNRDRGHQVFLDIATLNGSTPGDPKRGS